MRPAARVRPRTGITARSLSVACAPSVSPEEAPQKTATPFPGTFPSESHAFHPAPNPMPGGNTTAPSARPRSRHTERWELRLDRTVSQSRAQPAARPADAVNDTHGGTTYPPLYAHFVAMRRAYRFPERKANRKILFRPQEFSIAGPGGRHGLAGRPVVAGADIPRAGVVPALRARSPPLECTMEFASVAFVQNPGIRGRSVDRLLPNPARSLRS